METSVKNTKEGTIPCANSCFFLCAFCANAVSHGDYYGDKSAFGWNTNNA